MKQTVAAYIAKTLEQAGVKRIWGVTGDSAGHRRPHPVQRNRQRLFSGNPSSGAVPRVQPLLRTGLHAGADPAGAGSGDA